MSPLERLQHRLLCAVLAEHPVDMPGLCGDGVADTASRLDVYRHGYRARLQQSLRAEYPGLALLAGDRFTPMLEQYIRSRPPSHFDIREHGRELPAFLGRTPPWSARMQYSQMATFERAISTAFAAPDEAVLSRTELSACAPERWPDLRLKLACHVREVSITCNVEAIRRAVDADAARPRLRRYGKARSLLVWRGACAVHYRLISPFEQCLLEGLRQQRSMAELCQHLGGRRGPNIHVCRRVAQTLAALADGECLRASDVA